MLCIMIHNIFVLGVGRAKKSIQHKHTHNHSIAKKVTFLFDFNLLTSIKSWGSFIIQYILHNYLIFCSFTYIYRVF